MGRTYVRIVEIANRVLHTVHVGRTSQGKQGRVEGVPPKYEFSSPFVSTYDFLYRVSVQQRYWQCRRHTFAENCFSKVIGSQSRKRGSFGLRQVTRNRAPQGTLK